MVLSADSTLTLRSAVPALQRYTIRDLNTGQLYALNNDASLHSSGNIDVGGPERVTDLISGQELSLDEFEAALGLSAVLDVSMHGKSMHAGWGCQLLLMQLTIEPTQLSFECGGAAWGSMQFLIQACLEAAAPAVAATSLMHAVQGSSGCVPAQGVSLVGCRRPGGDRGCGRRAAGALSDDSAGGHASTSSEPAGISTGAGAAGRDGKAKAGAWLRQRFFSRLQASSGHESDDSDATSRASSSNDLQVKGLGRPARVEVAVGQ